MAKKILDARVLKEADKQKNKFKHRNPMEMHIIPHYKDPFSKVTWKTRKEVTFPCEKIFLLFFDIQYKNENLIVVP